MENKNMLEALQAILNLDENQGREGCTYGDTDYDSLSVCYGYNLALTYAKEIVNKKLQNEDLERLI